VLSTINRLPRSSSLLLNSGSSLDMSNITKKNLLEVPQALFDDCVTLLVKAVATGIEGALGIEGKRKADEFWKSV
jgi:hypothetical protein